VSYSVHVLGSLRADGQFCGGTFLKHLKKLSANLKKCSHSLHILRKFAVFGNTPCTIGMTTGSTGGKFHPHCIYAGFPTDA
jgi:hypothetical protein